MSAELCPVCKGSGAILDPAYGQQTSSSGVPVTKPCHGCNGKGWVDTNTVPFQGPCLRCMVHSGIQHYPPGTVVYY